MTLIKASSFFTGTPIDFAVRGADALGAEAIAPDLEDQPLPYHFDMIPFELIQQASLREHIERIGVPLPIPR